MTRELIFKRMLKNRFFVAGGIVTVLIVVLTFLSPLYLHFDPIKNSLPERLVGPDWSQGFQGHVFGTDALGRDVLSRLLDGGRYSLAIGFIIVILQTVIGTALGILAGYAGKLIDTLIMRVCDIFLALPNIVMAIAIIAILGTSITNLVIVLTLSGWVANCKVTRNAILVLKNKEFVLASKAFGASHFWIMVKHMLPNVTTPMIVLGSQKIGGTILTESALSYLNLGIQPPTPSWGNMISDGRAYLATCPWLVFAPGIALMLTALAFNFLGDGLRDVLDPKAL